MGGWIGRRGRSPRRDAQRRVPAVYVRGSATVLYRGSRTATGKVRRAGADRRREPESTLKRKALRQRCAESVKSDALRSRASGSCPTVSGVNRVLESTLIDPDHGAQLPWERVRELLLDARGARLSAQVGCILLDGYITEPVEDPIHGGVNLHTNDQAVRGELAISPSTVHRTQLCGNPEAPTLCVDLNVEEAWIWGRIEITWGREAWQARASAAAE